MPRHWEEETRARVDKPRVNSELWALVHLLLWARACSGQWCKNGSPVNVGSLHAVI